MSDDNIMRLPSRPSKGTGKPAVPADLVDEGPNQAEVLRDLATYLVVFLTIALTVSLLVRVLSHG
jgi:hypothetical protein